MSLSLDLASALTPLSGQTFYPPKTVSARDSAGLEVSLELLGVERLGVSCDELRLRAPLLANSSLDTLKKWADGLCRRVTYLLENLGPLEYDATSNEVLIRSTPPDATQPQAPKFYEIVLSSTGAGCFTLRRYRADRASGGRVAVPLDLTHEQLAKLVNDLVATLPAAP